MKSLRSRPQTNIITVRPCTPKHQVDPRILVVTLEIVDMHEAFQRQKAEQARARAQM